MLRVLLTATVQSHICQFHKPLVKMLRSRGEVEIHVAARNNLAEKNGMKLDFADKVFDVSFSRSPSSPQNLKAYRQLKDIIRNGNYDYIHCNTPVGGVVTRLAAQKARKAGTKVIYTAHGFHFYRGASKKNWALYYPVEKLMARKTDILITINDEDYALARKKFRCRAEHIHGVGVDPDRYHTVSSEEKKIKKQQMGFRDSERLILSVGELLPNKNHVMALRAVKEAVNRFPDIKLLIAGNGPEKENIEAEIRRLGMENHAVLLGYCTHLEDYQQICDLSLACSKREGLPLNVVEALLSGNPVIATHNRGHNELILNGENGYLVRQDDSGAMAERIVCLLSDSEVYRRLSRRCTETARAYTAGCVAEELERIYFDD